MKIALLSNVNIDLLAQKLEPMLKEPEFYVAGFNQYIQELLDLQSKLNNFSPDIVIVHIDGRALFSYHVKNPFSNIDLTFIGREAAGELVNTTFQYLERNPKTFFLLNSIVLLPETILGNLEYNSNYSIEVVEQVYNLKIRELVNNNKTQNIIISNWNSIVKKNGYDKIFDNRYWYLGRIPYSIDGLGYLAECYNSSIRAIFSKPKKIIALDLDNTLWGGIIGEDGIEGIKLGEQDIGKSFRDFQMLLKSMKSKGILLTIVSKNNLSDAMEVFNKHPMMVLSPEDFAVMKINWNPKSTNLREVADELSLGLDSIVMIDDNPAERMEISSQLPMVEVPEFPSDPSFLPEWFISINQKYFDKLSVTIEDSQRLNMYKIEVKRKKLQKGSRNLEDFLKNLAMVATIGKNTKILIPRISQLTMRTNQFNMTTKRYSEPEIANFMDNDNYIIYDLELDDKFGSNGVVGIIIVRFEDETAIFDTFLMSCRVIGRMAENAFVWFILSQLKKIGIKKVIGLFNPTKKNNPAKGVFGKLGFKLSKISGNGNETWSISLDNIPKYPQWIKIKER
jgi:FkbH-like protein